MFLLAGFLGLLVVGLSDSTLRLPQLYTDFELYVKRVFNRLNPTLCMGVIASVDIVITCPSSVFKIFYKRNTEYIKRQWL